MIIRRRETKKIINRRLKQIKRLNKINSLYSIKDIEQPHRLAKRHALGCHRSHCKICHHEKYDDKIRETEI